MPREYTHKIVYAAGNSAGNRRPLVSKITIELTERCNNNCIHCCINLPANDKEARNRELTAEEIKKVLIEAASLGCRSVKFTGGEPLLRDDIVELCLFAKRLKLIVEVAVESHFILTVCCGLS